MTDAMARFPMKPVLAVSGGASLLALVAFVLWGMDETTPSRAVAAHDATLDGAIAHVRWPAGERHIYRLEYANEEMMRPIVDDSVENMVSDPVTAQVKAEFDVAVTGMGPGEGETDRVAFEVTACHSASLIAAEQAVWPSAAACTTATAGRVLAADVERSGRIARVFDNPEDEASTRLLLQTLLMRLQVNLAPGANDRIEDQWFSAESAIAGVASQIYRVEQRPHDDMGWIFGRRTTAFGSLRAAQGMRTRPVVTATGSAEIGLSTAGTLERVVGDEALSATTATGVHFWNAKTTFAFTHLRTEKVAVPTLSAMVSTRLATEVPASKNAEQDLLENQADGLTLSGLLENLSAYGNGGRFPKHERFLWRAVGLLKLHPEYAQALLPLYRDPKATNTLKALVLDLLASAGGPEAQAAMRDVLRDPALLASATPQERQLYQRLGFLSRPTEETVEMVVDHYREFRAQADAPDNFGPRLTTAYSLGALAGSLGEGTDEDRERASTLQQMLVDDLDDATDPETIHHLVTALGNAKHPATTEVLEGLSEHTSSKVRTAVGRAFGKTPTDAPPEALLGLVGDDDVMAQRAAIGSLSPHASSYQALLDVVVRGALAPTNIRIVLDLIKHGRAQFREATTTLLEALIASGIERGLDREAAFQLLAM